LPHGGEQRAGLVYDRMHDQLTAFLYDPICRERFEIWSENGRRLDASVSDWMRSENQPLLPILEHRSARRRAER